MNTKERNYNDYLSRALYRHGDKFTCKNLSNQFIKYYNNQQRIEVNFGDGLIKRGRVGITTGWAPVFILLLTKRSRGSSFTLSDQDTIRRIT